MRIGELRWLTRQSAPVWQGVVGKEHSADNAFHEYLRNGLVQRRGDGYVITHKGRIYVSEYDRSHPACPTCGQQLPKL
jgi:hypothetical protein